MTAPSQETFVPLAAACAPNGRREDFRVLVAQRPETARSLVELNPAFAPGQNHRHTCEPCVTLQRDANVITGIRIECSCGQIIDLKCGYQETPPPPDSSPSSSSS
jgi:hypothetical protein